MKYVTIINNEQYEVEIEKDGTLLVNGEPRNVDFLPLGPSLYSVITNDKSLQAVIEDERENTNVLLNGRLYETRVLDERTLMMLQRKGGLLADSGEVRSPMPGLIVTVPVSEGDTVTAGQTIVILESMKMQNELKAPIDGTVTAVHVTDGQTVDKDAPLVVVSPPDAE